MASWWTPRTSGELLAKSERLCWHIPWLASSVPAQSGDLLFRGSRRTLGARVRQVRGILRLSGASHLAQVSSIILGVCPTLERLRAAKLFKFEQSPRGDRFPSTLVRKTAGEAAKAKGIIEATHTAQLSLQLIVTTAVAGS
jgi:hypothetical protein